MRDTSKVDRTVVVDGIQELSKREMEDVTGGCCYERPGGPASLAIHLARGGSPPKPEPEPEPNMSTVDGPVYSDGTA